jgi:hypothetical protein
VKSCGKFHVEDCGKIRAGERLFERSSCKSAGQAFNFMSLEGKAASGETFQRPKLKRPADFSDRIPNASPFPRQNWASKRAR